MSELFSVILGLLAGGLLGILFFGGLWWTVQKVVSSTQPALLLVSSLVLRTIVTVAGFYIIISRGNWRRLLACVFGFLAARVLVTWFTRMPVQKKTRVAEVGGL